MPGGPLRGGRGWKVGINEDRCLYIIKDSKCSMVLVREVEPYYGKYKGILATDNIVQLKRYYGSATGSLTIGNW
jgi:hypothetical protein